MYIFNLCLNIFQELSEGDGMDWMNSQLGDSKEESSASTTTKHDRNIAGSAHASTHSLVMQKKIIMVM
jgi:hypothetical protein